MKKLTEVTKPNVSETHVTETNKDLNKENEFLQSKLKSLEESYRLKCEDYNKLLNAYRGLALKLKTTNDAIKTITKSYNLSLELILQENGGEH